MPRDITKEEANSDWSTSIIEFGETAASVTAGAAVLYRGLSGRKVSRLSNRYIRKIKALDRTISSRNYDDWNKKEIRSVYNSLKDQFQQIERTPSDGVILGNNKNPRSVFESISKAFKLIDEADIGAIGKSQAMSRIDENIRRYALQQLQANLPEHLQIDEQNIEKFVRDLLRTIHLNNDRTEYVANTFDANAVLWRYRRKSYGRSAEEHGLNRDKNVVDKIAQNIQQYAIDIKNNNIDALKQKGNGEIERNIAKELLKIEALEKQTGSGKYETSMSKLKDSALGDSSATIGQILDAYNDASEDEKRRLFIGFDYRALRQAEDNSNSKYIYEPVNVLNKLTEYLEQLSEEDRKRFRNIKADPYIRFDGSNIYSLNEIADLKDKAMDILSGTMVGKILKLRDIHEGSKVPSVFEIRAGSLNPLSAGVLNEIEDKKRLENTYWYIHGNIFEQAEDGTLIKSEKYSGDVVARSGRLGTTSRLVRSMFGMESRRDMTGKPILDYLDIGTTTDINILQDIRSFFGVRTDDRVNMEGRLKRAIENPHPNLVVQYRTDKKIMDFLDSNILELNHETVQKLLDAETNEADKDILRLIQTDFTSIDNSSLIDVIIGRNADGNAPYLNQELNTLITRFQKDEWKTADILKLQRDQSKAYYHGDSIGLRLDDILRMELGKEYFLRKAVSVQNKNKIAGFDIIKEIIENAGLSNESEYAAKKMGYYAYTDYLTGIFHDRTTDSSAEEVQKAVDMFRGMFFATDKNSGYYDAGETFKKVAADQNSFLDVEKFKYDTDTIPEISPDYVVLKEGVGPLALIQAANESIRTGDNSIFGDRVKDFFKQFIAGRNTPEDVTTYTMAPYFFTHRLGTGLNYFGLGFSNSSTGSVIDMWKTILFKRIALSGAIATELDWVSDTFGAITGTPGSAAIVNGFANVDLGLRKVSDTLGITGLIDGAMDFAPFSYLSDGNTFNSYEEEKKYYESGYEPIRKGRYWFFGSANEFRGGQIEYFRPNLTRRLNSDYYNKSLYSGYWDKWGHSLLPTPAMPFSPLIYALDPYYLENEHKYDRPYPVSAPMFSENTPWGIVLNPTIGELIKPKTKLNTDRMDDGSDVLALIANINNQIRQTVLDDTEQNSIILNNGKLTPSIYVAYDHPTPNQIIYRPGYSGSRYINSDGEIDFDSTFGIPEEGVNMEEYAEAIENNKGNIIASRQDGFISRNESRYGSDRLGILDNAMLKSSVFRYPAEIIKGVISNVESTITGRDNSGYNYSGALSVIAQANKDIREKAIAGDNGIFVGDKLSYNRSSINEIVNKDTEIQELVNRGSGYDLVHQTATATRLVAGIYGYMGNELLGLGDFNNKHIANAGNIDSFARSFWDASIGGLGGEVSEIARRFIPEYRRRTELNPLLNDMPEWMPERFRMGDPYASIPYGEARLPGKGYEALNQLHPDQYGYYGALDRFKILADVAPYSEELKIWRKLAFHEYRGNTEVLKEIDEIQERINEQSKVHDFYDYRFIGKNAEYKQAVVSRVMDNGTFMIVGSDEVHKLAGVDFNNYDDSSQELLSQFIGPGAQVTIATDSNQYHKYDSNGNVNAAVFIDGESLSETLYDEKLVKKRKGTTNAADIVAMHSGLGRTAGYVLEALAHTEVPLLSSRWLKIQSPIESYKDEQIYGTSYQSWSDIIGTTIMPSWYKAISDPWAGVKETMSFAMLHYFHKQNITGLTKASMVNGAMSLVDRGAFMGGAIAYFIKPDDGDLFKKGQKIGALASLAGNLYTSTQGSYLGAAANWGLAGFMVGDLLDDSKTKENRAALESSLENKLENTAKTYGEDSINHEVQKMENSILKFVRGSESLKFRGKYTLAGAGIGVALAGMFGNGVFSDEDHWIPEKTKKKWEIEDYFDRLTYLKYMGLYEQAARKAYSEEGISVKKIVDELDAAQTDAQTIKEHLRDLIGVAQNHNLSNDTENKEIIEANTRLNQIRSSQLILKGGAYTRAALMYKQAAEATMYGLKDNASWQEIAQALPKYERDYFVEFMKEKDPEEQEKILREASPFMRRALKQVWKYDDYKDEQKEDNTEFFSHHNLPGPFSDIWIPEVNLNDVKAKVVKNEGLLSSDFGIYESQYKEASTINAPNITMNGNQNILELQLELATILNGNGLVGTDVRIEPTSTSGIKSVINVAKVTNYNVGEMVRDAI